MRLVAPWWLLAMIPAIALVVVVARGGRMTVPPRQHRLAVIVRSIGIGLLVLALAQPLLVRTSRARSVVFLLDRSASITDEARVVQESYVREAAGAAGPTDRTAVAVFGRDVRLDEALSSVTDFVTVRTVVDQSATDLASALRASAAVMPTEGSRRIVVLTDAVETLVPRPASWRRPGSRSMSCRSRPGGPATRSSTVSTFLPSPGKARRSRSR